jgi:tetratricopeptide (TPR) repeat protein
VEPIKPKAAAKKAKAPASDKAVQNRASGFDTERLLRATRRIQGGNAFSNLEEAQRFYDQFKGMKVEQIQALAGHDPVEDAQEMAYRAMEANSLQTSGDLARKALALDPDCIDALNVLAAVEATNPEDYVARLKTVVAKAESLLDKTVLKEHKGQLWGVLEARPYLRARLGLGTILEKSGRFKEALPHFEALLELNESDNQGVRYHFIRTGLALGNKKELTALFKRFKDDDSAIMAWADVLIRLKSKDMKGIAKTLETARKTNPLVEEFLTGKRRIPKKKSTHTFYTPGSEEEALTVLSFVGEAWLNDRAAMYWLMKGGTEG